MAQQAEDAAAQRMAALEDAAWRTRTRLEALSARTAQLETEREASRIQHDLLVREQQALTEQNALLQRQAAELSNRLDSARDKVALLQRQLAAQLTQHHKAAREQRVFSRKLGLIVAGLLNIRPGEQPSRRTVNAGVKVLSDLGLVDPQWYKTTYPDVAAAGIDPVRHYLCHGALEGRSPRDLTETP